MLSGFRKLFRPPIFDDLEKATQALSIHTILLGTLAVTFLFLIYAIFFQPLAQLIIAVIAIAIEFGLLALVQAGRIQLASLILCSLLWAALALETTFYGGIRAASFGGFAAIILIAGLTMGGLGGFIFTALSLVAAVGLAFAENQGFLPANANLPVTSLLFWHGTELIAVALLIYLAIRSISAISRKIGDREKDQQAANVLLQASQADLQQRTSALERQNITLQTLAAVSRISNDVESEEEFLEQSARLLIEQNKLELVSIFVLDQMEENAILQISRSQPGKPLPMAGYKLTIIRSESTNLLMGVNTLHFKIGEWNYYIDSPKQLLNMQTTLNFPLVSNEHLYGILNIQDGIHRLFGRY